MSMEKLLEKNINESKQGEIFQLSENKKASRKMYIESYGCQMNFSDSEIVASILTAKGFSTTKHLKILSSICFVEFFTNDVININIKINPNVIFFIIFLKNFQF